MRQSALLFVIITLAMPVVVSAQVQGSDDSAGRSSVATAAPSDRGWFFYKEPPEEEEEKPKSDSPSPAQPATTPAPLSSEWIKKNYPTTLTRALDNPTEENLRTVMLLQRLMLDKGQVFSDQWQSTLRKTPYLDENNRMPISSAAKLARLESSREAKSELHKELKDKLGIVLFMDTQCDWCVKQLNAVSYLAKTRGYVVRVISKDNNPIANLPANIVWRKDNSLRELAHIQVWPGTALLIPPDKVALISQGFTTTDALDDQIIAVANELGMVDVDKYADAYPMRAHMLSSEQDTSTTNKSRVNWDNQDSWGNYLYEKLNGMYEK